RDDLLMSIEDAERLQLREGDWVMVRSAVGEMRARCRIAAIAPGNVQAHWPEANLLIRRGATDKRGWTPHYNVAAQIERCGQALLRWLPMLTVQGVLDKSNHHRVVGRIAKAHRLSRIRVELVP